MRYTGEDELVKAGFAIVRKYDPRLYARMQRESWLITEDETAARGMGADAIETQESFALTAGRKPNGLPYSLSWVNAPLIQASARAYRIPVDLFTAATLAHEFRHTLQSDHVSRDTVRAESEAFQFSAKFSERLPAPYGAKLAQYQIDTMHDMARGKMPMYNAQHAANNV